MNIFAKTTVLTFSVLALSSVSYAANYNSSSSDPNVNAQSFEQLDKNKDGVLDKKEARAAGLNFKKTDTDKDGKVSRSEYETGVAMGHGGKDANPSTSESMSDMDAVRNGTLPSGGADSSGNASQNNSSSPSYGSQSNAGDSSTGTSSSGNTSNSMGGASRNGTGTVPDTTSSTRSSKGY